MPIMVVPGRMGCDSCAGPGTTAHLIVSSVDGVLPPVHALLCVQCVQTLAAELGAWAHGLRPSEMA